MADPSESGLRISADTVLACVPEAPGERVANLKTTGGAMYQQQKIEEAVLALLGVFHFDDGRVWKRYDFAVMESLWEQGCISDPRSKAESVLLTPQGLARAQQLARQLLEG